MTPILHAAAFVAVFIGAGLLRHWLDNRRWKLCGACRLDKEPGRSVCYIPHSCSRSRAYYVSPDGTERTAFGRPLKHGPTPPRAVLTRSALA